MARRKSRSGRAAAVLGGAGLLAWLLLRRAGWRFGRAAGARPGPESSASRPPCQVRLDQAGIKLDGVPADLSSAVRRCRITGSAEVTATGAAVVGAIAELLTALQAVGVLVHADPALWEVTGLARPDRSTP